MQGLVVRFRVRIWSFLTEVGQGFAFQVSVFLETHEVVNPIVIHPSRKQAGVSATLPNPSLLFMKEGMYNVQGNA